MNELNTSSQNTAELAALCLVVEALIATHPEPTAVAKWILQAREMIQTSSVDLPPDQIDLLRQSLDTWYARIAEGRPERLLSRLRG